MDLERVRYASVRALDHAEAGKPQFAPPVEMWLRAKARSPALKIFLILPISEPVRLSPLFRCAGERDDLALGLLSMG